jgi:uncharacterized delta-60 repeat protein
MGDERYGRVAATEGWQGRRRRYRGILFLALLLAIIALLDGWRPAGAAADQPTSDGFTIAAVAVQPDGKVVVAGSGGGDFVVARYRSDGTLDPGFGGDGWTRTDFGGDDRAEAVTVAPDGKIVVAGGGGPAPDFAVARYQPDGSPDRGFHGGTVTTDLGGVDAATTVDIQGGKVLVGGGSTRQRGAEGVLVRYTGAGALDASFDGDGRLFDGDWQVLDVLVQPDLKAVVLSMLVQRFLPAGHRDRRFANPDVNGGGSGFRRTDRQSTGHIVLAGASDCNTAPVLRLDPATGEPDRWFGGGTQTTGAGAIAVLVLSGDRVLVVSDSWQYEFCSSTPAIVFERYLADGRRDAGFGENGGLVVQTSDWPATVETTPVAAALAGSSIVVVGRNYLARFTTDGARDVSFGADGVVTDLPAL